MGCFTDKLSADIAIDCDNISIGGVEEDIVIIAHEDVDKVTSTINSSNRLLLDDFNAISGKSGFLLEGIKNAQGILAEFVPSEETLDKWRHVYDGVIATPSALNRFEASKLAKGESYMIVVRTRYKGVSKADEFKVLGWDAGLYVTAMTENSRENDGMIKFTLSSKDNSLEYNTWKTLLETDNATTLIAFGNKFATV